MKTIKTEVGSGMVWEVSVLRTERAASQTDSVAEQDVELAGWKEPCFRANTFRAGYQMKKVHFFTRHSGP